MSLPIKLGFITVCLTSASLAPKNKEKLKLNAVLYELFMADAVVWSATLLAIYSLVATEQREELKQNRIKKRDQPV